MWSGRVPGTGRTGKISFKDRRILGGQGLDIPGLEQAAAPFLVALSPWSSLLQAFRVTFLNHIWPSHSPPLTLLCPRHPWGKIQVPKDSQHSRQLHNKQLPFPGLFLFPRRLLDVPECTMCVHTSRSLLREGLLPGLPSLTWSIPPHSLRPSPNVHSSPQSFLRSSLLETLNCSIFMRKKKCNFSKYPPLLAPENFDLKYHVWFIWVS